MTLDEFINLVGHDDPYLLNQIRGYEIQINNASAVFPKDIVEHVHGTNVGLEFLGSSIFHNDKKIVIELRSQK